MSYFIAGVCIGWIVIRLFSALVSSKDIEAAYQRGREDMAREISKLTVEASKVIEQYRAQSTQLWSGITSSLGKINELAKDVRSGGELNARVAADAIKRFELAKVIIVRELHDLGVDKERIQGILDELSK